MQLSSSKASLKVCSVIERVDTVYAEPLLNRKITICAVYSYKYKNNILRIQNATFVVI